MLRHAFVTVTDHDFFPGTLATVNSVLAFHPAAEIFVINLRQRALTAPQRACLLGPPGLRVLESTQFETEGRHIGAWELKAYALSDLASGYDVIIGIDSDCLLCGDVSAEILDCWHSGGWYGGQDGTGVDYDDGYARYGIATPARNARYMSTSLVFCAVTEANIAILRRWAACCDQAVFNGRGPYLGHGDQGVLNAVLFAAAATDRITLLDNRLWSQHWVYWNSALGFRHGRLVNHSAGGQAQRSLHCGGTEKFWLQAHADRVLGDYALQTYAYVWFLALLWFGTCRDWSVDPCQYLPPASHHLVADLVHYLPQIFQVFPSARPIWDGLSDPMTDRILNGVHRFLSLHGGSMNDLIALVAANSRVRRYVEVGGYEAGSILTLALRFANRPIDFVSVESFMGDKSGTMDGHRLPSRRTARANLARYPTLRVRLLPGESELAADLFEDASLDMVFIDAGHDVDSVRRDIDAWLPKLAPDGILAGDDYTWSGVRQAVEDRFGAPNLTPTGHIWWIEVTQ